MTNILVLNCEEFQHNQIMRNWESQTGCSELKKENPCLSRFIQKMNNYQQDIMGN
jgi:hypothetical protein